MEIPQQIQSLVQKQIKLEACVNSFEEAVRACGKGANRLELCTNMHEGGTTPSYGTILVTKQLVEIPIISMIRPRGGNFLYSDEEIEIMRQDIIVCRQIGISGVIFGVLDQNNNIDIAKNKLLLKECETLCPCFHMAIDNTPDISAALETLIELGFKRVLTKGGNFENAEQGKDSLKQLIQQSNGRIIVMPGKGINKSNRDFIIDYTNASEVHGTAIV